MATTVGQHSVASFTSPVNGTTPIDANTVRGNDNTIRVAYVDHDADPGIHVQSSTLASRPTAGTAGRKWITEDSGVYTLWFDDGTNWHPVSSENVALTVLAGENLVKGDVVKVTGWNNGQDLPEVAKVSSASDVAFAIMTAAVSSGSMGYATNTGIVQDVNTNSFAVGTILYPNTSGGFTSTKPTSGNYQTVAFVLRQNANNGVIFVEFSSPRIVERSDNTVSTIVLRDASGNFSAGTITAGALTSTGLVTFASLKGTGATTVTNILDEDNMASDSATALATQQSIKAYVDAKVATVDTLAEVLANGNTTGANDIIVNAGQKIRTPVIASQNNATAITIADTTGALTLNTALADSNLATISTAGKVANSATTATSANTASAIVARDASGNFTAGTITATLSGTATQVSQALTAGTYLTSGGTYNGSTARTFAVDATDANTASKVVARDASGNFAAGTITATLNGAAPAGSLSGSTLASGVTASSLTSVGTLTSLTVSGDLTVDTSTLKVDSANNRVGIGTASPGTALEVGAGSGSPVARINGSTTTGQGGGFMIARAGTEIGGVFSGSWATSGAGPLNSVFVGTTTAEALLFGINYTEKMRLDASGNLAVDTNTLYVDAANNRVGIRTNTPGVGSGAALEVAQGTSGSAVARLVGPSAATSTTEEYPFYITTSDAWASNPFGLEFTLKGATAAADRVAKIQSVSVNSTTGQLVLQPNGGNLGLGVTPSAWALSGLSAMQIKNASFFGYANNAYMSANEFIDAASSPKYIATAAATRYQQGSGAHTWYTAASGTAGNTISFTQAMTLDSSGNLGVGTASPDGRIYASETTNGLAYFTFRNPSTGGSAVARLRVGNSGSENAFTIDVHGSSHATLANITRIFNQFTAPLVFGTDGTERVRIDASGNLLVGATSPYISAFSGLTVQGLTSGTGNNLSLGLYKTGTSQILNGDVLGNIYFYGVDNDVSAGDNNIGARISAVATTDWTTDGTTSNAALVFYTHGTTSGAAPERARIRAEGEFLVGTTNYAPGENNVTGHSLQPNGLALHSKSGGYALLANRKDDDGTLVSLRQDGNEEGTISVSGNTVSYNAFAGSHWSQLEDGSKPEILRGTVMEALNELCEWPNEQNERLPKAKVSDTAGSKKVYGVFMAWDNDWTVTNDMYVTAVGAFICRVAADVVVEQGDLLESNGDGTARVQADDVIRSSTIGKVTSTVKTHEYEDGTYCVPTVLYCG